MSNAGVMRGWVVVGFVLSACAGHPEDAAKSPDVASPEGTQAAHSTEAEPMQAASDAASETSASHAANTTSSPSTPSPPAGPPPRERIRIHNSCNTPVRYRIVRVSDAELQTSITNGTSTEERAKDGDEIRLMGEDNKVLATLKIEPSMPGIDFTSSCTGIVGQ